MLISSTAIGYTSFLDFGTIIVADTFCDLNCSPCLNVFAGLDHFRLYIPLDTMALFTQKDIMLNVAPMPASPTGLQKQQIDNWPFQKFQWHSLYTMFHVLTSNLAPWTLLPRIFYFGLSFFQMKSARPLTITTALLSSLRFCDSFLLSLPFVKTNQFANIGETVRIPHKVPTKG